MLLLLQGCFYVSTRKGNLARHTMSHTKERPHHCKFCPYSSAVSTAHVPLCLLPPKVSSDVLSLKPPRWRQDNGAVTRHERQHTNDYPTVCNFKGCSCETTSVYTYRFLNTSFRRSFVFWLALPPRVRRPCERLEQLRTAPASTHRRTPLRLPPLRSVSSCRVLLLWK